MNNNPTIAELVAELRKAGKVEVPVNSRHDTFYILVEKSDLIRNISEYGAPSDPAPWYVSEVHPDGTRSLDVNDNV